MASAPRAQNAARSRLRARRGGRESLPERLLEEILASARTRGRRRREAISEGRPGPPARVRRAGRRLRSAPDREKVGRRTQTGETPAGPAGAWRSLYASITHP